MTEKAIQRSGNLTHNWSLTSRLPSILHCAMDSVSDIGLIGEDRGFGPTRASSYLNLAFEVKCSRNSKDLSPGRMGLSSWTLEFVMENLWGPALAGTNFSLPRSWLRLIMASILSSTVLLSVVVGDVLLLVVAWADRRLTSASRSDTCFLSFAPSSPSVAIAFLHTKGNRMMKIIITPIAQYKFEIKCQLLTGSSRLFEQFLARDVSLDRINSPSWRLSRVVVASKGAPRQCTR